MSHPLVRSPKYPQQLQLGQELGTPVGSPMVVAEAQGLEPPPAEPGPWLEGLRVCNTWGPWEDRAGLGAPAAAASAPGAVDLYSCRLLFQAWFVSPYNAAAGAKSWTRISCACVILQLLPGCFCDSSNKEGNVNKQRKGS